MVSDQNLAVYTHKLFLFGLVGWGRVGDQIDWCSHMKGKWRCVRKLIVQLSRKPWIMSILEGVPVTGTPAGLGVRVRGMGLLLLDDMVGCRVCFG